MFPISVAHPCEKCGKEFGSKYLLEQHKFVHFKQTFCCTRCPYTAKSLSVVAIHMRTVHSVAPDGKTPSKPPTKKDPEKFRFQCYVCKRKLFHAGSLRTHLAKVHPLKNCPVCDDDVVPGDTSHACLGNRPLTCEYCASSFGSLHELLIHLANGHSEMEKQHFICDICRRKFRMRMLMDAHREKHTPGSFGCEECPEVFDTKLELKNHSRLSHPKVGSEANISKVGLFHTHTHTQKSPN